MTIERENFWETIDEWTDTTVQNAELFGNSIGFHDKILEEAKRLLDGHTRLMV